MTQRLILTATQRRDQEKTSTSDWSHCYRTGCVGITDHPQVEDIHRRIGLMPSSFCNGSLTRIAALKPSWLDVPRARATPGCPARRIRRTKSKRTAMPSHHGSYPTMTPHTQRKFSIGVAILTTVFVLLNLVVGSGPSIWHPQIAIIEAAALGLPASSTDERFLHQITFRENGEAVGLPD